MTVKEIIEKLRVNCLVEIRVNNFKVICIERDNVNMEGFCKYDASSFEEIVVNARAKAIDEFVEMLKEKYEEHNLDLCLRQNDYYSYANSCIQLENYIDKIAEQMKAGGKNEID